MTAGIGDVQFLPVRVQHMDGAEIPGFSVLNVTAVLYPDGDADVALPDLRGDRVDPNWTATERLPKERLESHDALRRCRRDPFVYVSSRFREVVAPLIARQFLFVPVQVV
ncbi:MAG: hypothetical protein U0821_21415 [Chloroflexota bacterium]